MNDRKINEDRRRYERTEASLVGMLEEERMKGGEFSITTKNISRSGVYLFSPKYIEPFTIVRIKLIISPPGKKLKIKKDIECEGIIVRVERLESGEDVNYGLAVHFITLSDEDAELLEEFIGSNIKK